MRRFKRTIFVLLLAAAFIVAAAAAVSAESWLRGDADGDNEITSLDATVIQRVVTKMIDDKDGMIALRGDVNGDGLSLLDATAIQHYLAEMKNDDRIGEPVEATLPFVFPTEDNQLPILK